MKKNKLVMLLSALITYSLLFLIFELPLKSWAFLTFGFVGGWFLFAVVRLPESD